MVEGSRFGTKKNGKEVRPMNDTVKDAKIDAAAQIVCALIDKGVVKTGAEIDGIIKAVVFAFNQCSL